MKPPRTLGELLNLTPEQQAIAWKQSFDRVMSRLAQADERYLQGDYDRRGTKLEQELGE